MSTKYLCLVWGGERSEAGLFCPILLIMRSRPDLKPFLLTLGNLILSSFRILEPPLLTFTHILAPVRSTEENRFELDV